MQSLEDFANPVFRFLLGLALFLPLDSKSRCWKLAHASSE